MRPATRVQHYQGLARTARRAAKNARGEDRKSYVLMAEQFEFLAQAFEADAPELPVLPSTELSLRDAVVARHRGCA